MATSTLEMKDDEWAVVMNALEVAQRATKRCIKALDEGDCGIMHKWLHEDEVRLAAIITRLNISFDNRK